MVKRCAWGTCNSDERYAERLQGVVFIPFPKPKTQLDKCLRWIRACGRPHEQLNVGNINKHKFVCSKHFPSGNGPTADFLDPIPADGGRLTPVRPPPRKRLRLDDSPISCLQSSDQYDVNQENVAVPECSQTVSTQTDETWVSPLELLGLTTTIQDLQATVVHQNQLLEQMKGEFDEKNKEIDGLKEELSKCERFGIDTVLKRTEKLKGLFKYYTGITYIRFLALLTFLFPNEETFTGKYEKGRRDIRALSREDCLFLTLCRLRHAFGLKDISMRFGLSLQSSGIVFNAWIDHMYWKLGQLSIWPHRDIIIKNMPRDFSVDFPSTLVIIDGTEIRTQVPCALGLQSQLYSDYKSSTTLKCLVGCDPNGSLVFVSELFTGSISDKAITEQSGFYDLLSDLIKQGYIKEEDAIMADKGFTIATELKNLGLKLNIPPFAPSDTQMSAADTIATQKIATHRIHIERLIAKIKKFQIVSQRIPTSLFTKINHIWTVCSYMTLFQDVFVTDKEKK